MNSKAKQEDSKDSKKVKISIGEDDRISALPDQVLSHILSLLPTKDSVRTSVLSNRWEDLFASVPVINCDAKNPNGPSDPGSFIAFVYRLLYLIGLRLSHIHRFQISLLCMPLGAAILSSWISIAVSFNVQELIFLHVPDPGPITLPLPLFTCKSLTVLQLEGNFLFNVPHHVSFPSLKSILLFKAIFQDDSSVQRLLSGCPVIEDLAFFTCNMENIKVFHMSSPSMKKLRIHCLGDYELLFNAPHLECLKIITCRAMRCSGDAFKSLVEVAVSFTLGRNRDFSRARIPEFLNKASNARKLLLHGDIMKAIAYAPHSLPVFHALTRLNLAVNKSGGWESLPDLLNSSPCLETLILNGFKGNSVEFPLPQVPKCFHMHLKIIHLNLFKGLEEEFTLVEYILAEAKVLETVKLFSLNVPDELFSMTSERLLASPTYSKTCKIAWAEHFSC